MYQVGRQSMTQDVQYTGNGTAGREADVKPTAFFFQMPKQGEDYRAMYLKVRDELAEFQQRTWVWLTDEERKDLCRSWSSPMDAIYATESKLKDKNT